MPVTYCEAPSPAFKTAGCCGSTLIVNPPSPACQKCGEVPTLDSPNAKNAVSLCLSKAGHKGKHTWQKYGYG